MGMNELHIFGNNIFQIAAETFGNFDYIASVEARALATKHADFVASPAVFFRQSDHNPFNSPVMGRGQKRIVKQQNVHILKVLCRLKAIGKRTMGNLRRPRQYGLQLFEPSLYQGPKNPLGVAKFDEREHK